MIETDWKPTPKVIAGDGDDHDSQLYTGAANDDQNGYLDDEHVKRVWHDRW